MASGTSPGRPRMYLGVIVNPLARRNRARAGDRAADLRRIVGPWGEVHETASVEDLRKTMDRSIRGSPTSSATAATARCTG